MPHHNTDSQDLANFELDKEARMGDMEKKNGGYQETVVQAGAYPSRFDLHSFSCAQPFCNVSGIRRPSPLWRSYCSETTQVSTFVSFFFRYVALAVEKKKQANQLIDLTGQ